MLARAVRFPVVLAVLAGGAWAAAWAEGTQTGSIAGRVTDAAGRTLPQVAVAVAGATTTRTGLTDDDGRFRFPGLEVGRYRVTARLPGLAAAVPDVVVHVARRTEVELVMGEGGAAAPAGAGAPRIEALAPLIDPFATAVDAAVRRDFLDDLPVARFYQSAALLLPGLAGGEDGNPSVSGALRTGNLYLIDGVDTTDPTTGLFGLNLAYEAIAEVGVATAAAPVEYGRYSGGVLNVVTRAPGDAIAGSLRWLATDPSWDADYADPAPAVAAAIAAANATPGGLESTLAGALSGPLAGARLGFFVAAERSEDSLFRPTLAGEPWDEALELDGLAAKLVVRPRPGQTLRLQHTADSASFAAFSSFDRSLAENRATRLVRGAIDPFVDPVAGDRFALARREQEGDFTSLHWHWVRGADLALSATAARQERELAARPVNRRGLAGGAPHLAVLDFSLSDDGEVVFFDRLGHYNGPTDVGAARRRREQASAALDRFVELGGREHELRFGVDLQRTTSAARFNVAGAAGIDPATGRRVEGQLFLDGDFSDACLDAGDCAVPFDPATGAFLPISLFNYWQRPARETEMDTAALWASDAVRVGRLLVTLGLRWERVEATGDRGEALADDDSLAPYLGLKLDPAGDGRTLLSATWARFAEPFPQGFLDSFLEFEAESGFTFYDWGELLGRDCAGEDPADTGSRCWVPVAVEPFVPFPFADPDPELARASIAEVTLGVERQLTGRTSLRLTYVERDWDDLWDDVLELESDALGELVTATVENLPEARRSYRGVQLFLKRRLAERWQLLASYTWSRARGNLFQADGVATFADFRDLTDVNLVNRFGPAPYDRPHRLEVFATAYVPLGRHELTLGAAAGYRDGTPYQEERLEDLGVRFLTPRGSARLDGRTTLDLAAALDLALAPELDLRLKLELFNVTDARERLAVETDVDSPGFALPRTLEDLAPPRSLRVSAALDF